MTELSWQLAVSYFSFFSQSTKISHLIFSYSHSLSVGFEIHLLIGLHLWVIAHAPSHTPPIQPLTGFPNTMHHQSCVFPPHISFGKDMNHSHWSSINFDWHFICTTWHDTLVTIIIQCNTPITVYICDLGTFVSFGMCRVHWFAYYFTHHQH